MFAALTGVRARLDLSVVTTPKSRHYSFLMFAWGLIADVDIMSEFLRWMGETRFFLSAVYLILSKQIYHGRLSLLLATEQNTGVDEMPSLSNPVPVGDEERCMAGLDWKVIEGSFVLVWVVQSSHASSSMHSGPGVQLSDGIFTVYVVRKANRWELFSLLLSLDSGEFIQHRCVETYKVRAYRLEPESDQPGIYSMDGEVIDYGPMQAVMKQGAATVLKVS